MAVASYIHIFISPKNGITSAQVEQKMNLSLDWIRYTTGTYVVYTTSDVNTWMGRLKPLVEPSGHLFICEINVKKRNGWMTKDFWEWLKKEK